MALTPQQEAGLLQLLEQSPQLLSLAESSQQVIAELGAAGIGMEQIDHAEEINSDDLLLLYQDGIDRVARVGDLSVVPLGTVVVNLDGADAVALDLMPIAQGNQEILFNLPVAANAATTLSIINPPAAGTLAEFVIVVSGDAGSALVWPESVRWSGGVAPALTGAVGKSDTFVLYTQDGGNTYFGFVAGQAQ
jgi:hypothetical protein